MTTQNVTKTMYTLENCLTQYPELLTVKELQTILRMGRNRTFALVHSGVFRIIRCAHIIYVSKASVIDFLNGVTALDAIADTSYNVDGVRLNKEEVAK